MRRAGLLLLTLLVAQVALKGEFQRREVPLDEGHLSFLFRPGSAPVLILIPGSFWDSSLWDEVVPHLDREMSLVLVELRGHGRSWPPAKDGSIELFAADVLRVADALGLKEFYVGGHSIGGMVALELGDRKPEAVLGVISVEGWTNHQAPADAFNRRMADTLTPDLRKREAEGRARATGHWTEQQRDTFGQTWRRWDGSYFLQTTDLPVLELYGDRGRPKPTLEQLRIPDRANVMVRWIENASHNLPLERPAEVGEAMKRFIEEVESRGVGGLARGRVDVRGRWISYLFRKGSPTLVLIPGSHQDSRQWEGVVSGLHRELGLLIVELPGHGRSSVLRTTPTIEQFALDTLHVIHKLKLGRFYIGGHSIGGMVALEIGRVRPHEVAGIISIEGWTNHRVSQEAFRGLIYSTLTPELRAKQADLRARATGHWTEEQEQNWGAPWRRWDGSDFLQKTERPILELWGDRGLERPTREQLRIPDRENITLTWVANASHNLPLERPTETAKAMIQFIRKTQEVPRD